MESWQVIFISAYKLHFVKIRDRILYMNNNNFYIFPYILGV